MTEPTDLFGHLTGPDQLSLFGAGEDRLQAPRQNFDPDPEQLRRRIQALLAKARGAGAMPWPEREVRMWQRVFPNWTRFLPEEEGRQLRLEFASELERLKAA